MLVINPMTSDTRVDKQARALAAAGHSVTVVATHADGLAAGEHRDGYRILRLPYRRPVKDAITSPHRRATAHRRARREATAVARQAGMRASARRFMPIDIAMWAVSRIWLLAGGVLLKTIRSRALTWEYWLGLAKKLPERVEHPDVITAHDLGPLYSATRLARYWAQSGPRPKVVYDSHELYVEQQTRWTRREKASWRLHERRMIRHADLITTVSPGIAAELQRRYHLAERPLVILNSPEQQEPPSEAARPDVRTDVGGVDEVLAVYVGGAKPGRGVRLLIPALAAETGWHLALVGVGSNGYVEELLDDAERLGVRGRVHVLPAQPATELPRYLRSADVGVHPMEPTCLNHELALPNKLFDYLFAGLPVAVTSLREMKNLVDELDLGATFNPYEPAETARAVLSAARRRKPATSATNLAAWSWEQQAESLLAAYERLGQP